MDLDVITVQIVPEKKGLFLKHSEYEITSKKQQSTICRRYNDFVTLHGLLVTRCPYRIIPRLPPKQLMTQLEERRKGLQRWLRIVSRHPILGNEPLFIAFLRDTSMELQEHLRHLDLNEPDEFAKLSETVELPLEDQGRLAESRECMRTMLNSVMKLKQLTDQQAQRNQSQAKDIDEMGGVLQMIGSIQPESAYTEMAAGYKSAAALSEKCAVHQQNSISERFLLLIDLLTGHSDLCDRVERGIVSDHQKAMSKMLTLNKQRMKGVMRGTDAENVAAIHQQEVVQNGVLGALGRRSAFSLYCVQQETAFAQETLKSLPSIMLSFTYEQNQGHRNISKVWDAVITREADKLNK